MWKELEQAAKEQGCQTVRELPLSGCTTFRIGGAAALAVTVSDPRSLPALLRQFRRAGCPWMTMGNGSNLLVCDDGFRGVVVRLQPDTVQVDGVRLTCPAGTPLKQVCRIARDAGLSGLEFAYGIPGTVGGALFMNAGAYEGQMADVAERALVAGEEELYSMTAAEMALAYRQSVFMRRRDQVIVAVTVRLVPGDRQDIGARMEELLARRREKQPLEYPSAGSYFKRPQGAYAGALIEQCGLKGARVGDAQVSEKHAGFVINRGQATCSQVLQLEAQVVETVQRQCGVRLEREVQVIGGKE